MAHLYPLGLQLLVLLIVISECREVLPVTATVLATQEEEVVLHCSIANVTNPTSCYRVKWIKYASDGSQMKVILAREADENGQMSLFLTKLQKSHEGLYRCEIWQGWDCILVKNVSLKVKECKALQPVKAAPSTPVNLNCPLDIKAGQQEPQNISWEMLKGGKPASINSERVEMNGTSLSIRPVHQSDSGWYRCKYVLGRTQRCFDVNMKVQEAENAAVAATVTVASSALTNTGVIWKTREEGSSGAIIAVVASAVIGIAIMAALIGLFIYRRRSTHRVTQQTQRTPAGILESVDGYETVNLSYIPWEDPRNQQGGNHIYFPISDI